MVSRVFSEMGIREVLVLRPEAFDEVLSICEMRTVSDVLISSVGCWTWEEKRFAAVHREV